MTKDDEASRRSVVLIGSSGGGTATLGHTRPGAFVEIIETEFAKILGNVTLKEVVFVVLENGQGMDSAKDDDQASLFHMVDGSQSVTKGTLKKINQKVADLEESIANDIELGKVDGLISVSCKPSLFHQTLEAAATCGIPLVGTGGTSLATVSSNYRVKVVGNSGGSVATTPLTKAISFSHAFANEWGLSYRPWLSTSKDTPSWRSVLNSCLPVFWTVCLFKRALQIHLSSEQLQHPNAKFLIEILQSSVLPASCSVVMAHSRRSSPGVLMGALLAATTCQRTVLGGLLAGWMVAFLEEQLLYVCIRYGNVPATMTNLLTTGLVGISVAVILMPFAPPLAYFTDSYRYLLSLLVTENPENGSLEQWRLLGLSLWGALFCYGSKIGWYHSYFLPLILLEMELGDPALLGAMDQLALVLVCAGICAGTLVAALFRRAKDKDDTSFLIRGLSINLCCGDFVEACYPFMEKNLFVSMGGYVASSLSFTLLSAQCKSSAYLPFPLAIWLADDGTRMSLVSGVAFGIAFASAFVGSLITSTND